MLEGNGRAPPPVEGEKKGERERGKEKRNKEKDIRYISYKQTITTTIIMKQPTLNKKSKA